MTGQIFLAYHELGIPGRKLCEDFRGHLRYAVLQREFESQLTYLKNNNWRGVNVTECLSDSNPSSPAVTITFDDGCETDLIGAAPLLKEVRFNATFYVIAGWVGKPGYLSEAQVRELANLGFEIGCHSMHHRYLTGLSEADLRIEVVEAKARLEQMLGAEIDHLSCPGGFWNDRVARSARLCGYRTVVTSRTGINTERTDPCCLERVTVCRGTAITEFARICHGKGFLRRRAKERLLSVPKALLGADLYVRVHSVLHSK